MRGNRHEFRKKTGERPVFLLHVQRRQRLGEGGIWSYLTWGVSRAVICLIEARPSTPDGKREGEEGEAQQRYSILVVSVGRGRDLPVSLYRRPGDSRCRAVDVREKEGRSGDSTTFLVVRTKTQKGWNYAELGCLTEGNEPLRLGRKRRRKSIRRVRIPLTPRQKKKEERHSATWMTACVHYPATWDGID